MFTNNLYKDTPFEEMRLVFTHNLNQLFSCLISSAHQNQFGKVIVHLKKQKIRMYEIKHGNH